MREAAERGLSLSAYLREILAARTGEASAAYDVRSWEGLFDLFAVGGVAAEHDPDQEAREAFTAEFDRDVAASTRSTTKPARKRTRRAP